MPRIKREPIQWPAWRYGPSGESGIFNSEFEVPDGWAKKPGEAFVQKINPTLDRDELIDQLEKAKIAIDPKWGTAHMKKVLDDFCSPR